MYKKPLFARIWVTTSLKFPMVIFEPKPPDELVHRNAIRDAPNPPRLALISVTIARLKNLRRVTPSASSSGATHGSTSALGAKTIEEFCLRTTASN